MKINTIIHWDSLQKLKKLSDKSVDLIFADPPYNMQLKKELYRPNNTKVNWVDDAWDKFESFEDYDSFCISWLKECKRILKDTWTIWVIGSYHNIFRIGNIMQNLWFWVLNDITWYKTNPMPNFLGTRFTNATETLLWCSKSENQKKYTFNHKLMKRYNWGKQMTSVWQIWLCTWNERIKWKNWKKAHSTQKPEELLKRVILSTTKKWDIVLDPFFWSGTTWAVAKKLGRNFIWIEKEKEYIKIAKKRINNIENEIEEANWVETKKEEQIRVPFENLVKDNILKDWEILYTKKSFNKQAKVLKNWLLEFEKNVGSIHKIWALIQESPSCNGWKFWYILRNNETLLLDELRQEYVKQYLLIA